MFSTTTTTTLSPQPILRFHLGAQNIPPPAPAPPKPILEQIQALLAEMLSSLSLTPEQETLLKEWERDLLPTFNDLTPDQARTDAASHFCFIYTDIIDPMLDQEHPLAQHFEDIFSRILAAILPPGTDIEAFIEAEMDYDQEEKVLQRTAEIFFQTGVRNAYKQTNEFSQQFTQRFDSLKERLKKYTQDKSICADEIHETLDSLSTRISEQTQVLQELGEQTLQATERLKKDEQQSLKFIHDVEDLLKKLRA